MTPVRSRRRFSRLAERLVGRLSFRRVRLQRRLVELLRSEAHALGESRGDAIDLWEGLRGEFREHLRRGDPADFLRWAPVRRTMVKRGHWSVIPELAHLRARPDWRRRWRSAIRETTLGRPRPFPRCPWSSANLIHQAYHVCRFEEATGRSLASMRTIVEFGGGYGRLCHLVHDLGFTGTYVIFDLPEVAVLQRFYLRHLGLAVSDGRRATWSPGAVTVTDVGDLRAFLGERPPAEAAFVAIGSLSETPVALRDALLAHVEPFDAFLVFYSARQDQIDNCAYFAEWPARLPHHDWSSSAVPHLDKAAWYLFGRRRPSTLPRA
jgi:hypothetical protein